MMRSRSTGIGAAAGPIEAPEGNSRIKQNEPTRHFAPRSGWTTAGATSPLTPVSTEGRIPPTTAARSGCPQRRVAHRHRPFVPPRARPEVLTRIVAVPPRAVADAPTVLIVYASGVAAQTARPRRAPDKRRESQRWRRRVARSCRQCARPALRRPARLRVQVRHDAVTPKVSALSAE